MNQQEISKMRRDMGAIAIRMVQQDARLTAIQNRAAKLDEFAESIQPKAPTNFKEEILEHARESGEHPDVMAGWYGFNSFSEIPCDIPCQLQ